MTGGVSKNLYAAGSDERRQISTRYPQGLDRKCEGVGLKRLVFGYLHFPSEGRTLAGGMQQAAILSLHTAGPSRLMRSCQVAGPAHPDRRSGTERPTFCSRLSVLRGCARQVQVVAGVFELAGGVGAALATRSARSRVGGRPGGGRLGHSGSCQFQGMIQTLGFMNHNTSLS